jgi:hypothetical protein
MIRALALVIHDNNYVLLNKYDNKSTIILDDIESTCLFYFVILPRVNYNKNVYNFIGDNES